MSEYRSLSDLVWAKVALVYKSEPVSVQADRKAYDDLMAAHRVTASHLLGGSSAPASEILWLTEKMTWTTYCESVLSILNIYQVARGHRVYTPFATHSAE